MTKTYEFLGGGQAKAASHLELANNMRGQSFTPSDSLEEFMEDTAKRCKTFSGVDIRTDSADHFIDDLITHGYVTEV
ncbi:hypothetical protein [Pontibacter litorisediminis]|uniref:hypothetical protein n=1 Tax=Pontibacter litorisediminis TaxID=1846260 RepID=UPI0023EB93A3|nr:hypothetical protein [Pontibacter litorisediminis]